MSESDSDWDDESEVEEETYSKAFCLKKVRYTVCSVIMKEGKS